MPWTQLDNRPGTIGVEPAPKPEPVDLASPSVGEVWGAAFRQDNTVGSAAASKMWAADLDTITPGLDPWEKAKGTILQSYPDRLATIFNQQAFDALAAQIEMEEQDRRTLAAAGWGGTVAQIAAGVLDWPTLIPAGRLVQAGRLGYSVGRSAAVVGAATAGAVGAQESVLQATQEARPMAQSAIAVGGGALLGGLLGAGGAKLLDNLAWNNAAKALEREVYAPGPLASDVAEAEMKGLVSEAARAQPPTAPASAGAAAVDAPSLEGLAVYGNVARAAANVTAQLNPLLRALTSPSAETRNILLNLMENPVYLKANYGGQASARAVETIVKAYEGAHTRATEEMRADWIEARKAGDTITWDEYRSRVGQAMRTGDVDGGGSDFVTQSAQRWRSQVFDPLKQKAIDAGLLPEDVSVETAQSYFTRMYNVPKIEAREEEFKQIIREWARDEIERQSEQYAAQIGKKSSSLQAEIDDLEMSMLRRAEDAKRREAGGEIAVDPETERQIVKAVDYIRAKTKGPEPETLIQFLHRRGGLFDEHGKLEAIGISNKTRPGFIRKQKQTLFNKSGGLGLDTAARMAWDEGFIRSTERPTVNDLLDHLADDFGGRRRVVRESDAAAAADADVFDQVVADLERIGVDVGVRHQAFSTADDLKNLAKRVSESLNAKDRATVANLKKALADLQRQADDAKSLPEGEMASYIEEVVSSIYNKITGRTVDTQGESPFRIVANTRGPMKERTFAIADEKIAPFLLDDIEMVGRRYTRVMGADIELSNASRRLGGDGKPDLKAMVAKIRADYEKLRSGVTSEKELAKLSARERADIRDLEAVRDMLRGQYLAQQNASGWAKVVNAAMTFNYLRTMGGVTISSLTDVARPIMVHGLRRWIGSGVKPLVTNLKGFKMATKEAKLAGVVGERVKNATLATYAELTDPYSTHSPFQRFLDNTARMFSRATLMPLWNDFQKSFASVITQNRILENAAGWAKLSKKEMAYMNFLGIDQPMAERILSEFSAHGETIDGVRAANTDSWTDDIAREAYRAAIAKDVDSIIVTKGIGDVPLFARTPTGRALLQFKGFALAAHQRAFIRGMQEDQAAMVSGLIASTTIGAFIYYLKTWEAGRIEDLSDNPGRFLAEGLDRSGMFPLMFEINNVAEKIGAPGIYSALQAAFPDKTQKQPASRYATRSVVDSYLGPSVGAAKDVVDLAAAGVKADLTPADISAMRRMTPGASLPWVRTAIDNSIVPWLKESVE